MTYLIYIFYFTNLQINYNYEGHFYKRISIFSLLTEY